MKLTKASPTTVKKSVIVLFGAVLFYLTLSLLSAHVFTRPLLRTVGSVPQGFPESSQTIRFLTTDSIAIAGWLIPGRAQERAIVLLHGYRADRRELLERARWLNQSGYSLLMYDARGHGESQATRISIGLHERRDLEAAISFLRGRGFRQIACLGISQGAATILLAAESLDDLKCVILESPYTNAREAIDRRFRHHLGIPGWPAGSGIISWTEYLLSVDADSINPLHSVKQVLPPKLFISGAADQRTLASDVQRLYQAATGEKSLHLIRGAAHEDLMRFDSTSYQEVVGSFLTKHFMPGQRQHD